MFLLITLFSKVNNMNSFFHQAINVVSCRSGSLDIMSWHEDIKKMALDGRFCGRYSPGKFAINTTIYVLQSSSNFILINPNNILIFNILIFYSLISLRKFDHYFQPHPYSIHGEFLQDGRRNKKGLPRRMLPCLLRYFLIAFTRWFHLEEKVSNIKYKKKKKIEVIYW